MEIVITGSSGFIGSSLCKKLSKMHSVIGLDEKKTEFDNQNINQIDIDISDIKTASKYFIKNPPDIIIHCAGLAHQKIGSVSYDNYMRVNSEATENLAIIAANSNPNVQFIFLSSISVYGENPKKLYSQSSSLQEGVGIREDSEYRPSSDYAVSKIDAENRLIALFEKGTIRKLVILRLAPVYDFEWSLNLDRRIFFPRKLAFLKYGNGSQKLSALARPNLVDFIGHILDASHLNNDNASLVNSNNKYFELYNVCDLEAYAFSRIIRVFKKSNRWGGKPTIRVPLFPVWIATRFFGLLFLKKREWCHSCYDKLAHDLVFDNGRMLKTDFVPKHSLETIFLQ